MKQELLNEVIACLPTDRTLFPYYRDRYAPLLLSWMFHDALNVAEIERSRYSGLLQKAPTQRVLSCSGKGNISASELEYAWAEPHEQFLLTISSWGNGDWRWQQTTRPGTNLVLQVNLHNGYRKWFERSLPDDYQWIFSDIGHPVLRKGDRDFFRQTLGWVRLDLDFTTGEVLIEEIQTDWLRDIRRLHDTVSHPSLRNNREAMAAIHFCEFVLRKFERLWDEALLAAALWFSREELGLASVWYHTFDSGCRLKHITYRQPPRSLYTELPRRFCFCKTNAQPEFLMADKTYRRATKKQPSPQWQHLQL